MCLRDGLDEALRSALVTADYQGMIRRPCCPVETGDSSDGSHQPSYRAAQEFRDTLGSLPDDHVVCAYSAYDQVAWQWPHSPRHPSSPAPIPPWQPCVIRRSFESRTIYRRSPGPA